MQLNLDFLLTLKRIPQVFSDYPLPHSFSSYNKKKKYLYVCYTLYIYRLT